jgi:DNA-binding NarL/FixJ family response regulator
MILGRFEEITEIKKEEENHIRQLMKEQGNSNPLLKAALPVIKSKLEGNVKHLPVSKQAEQPKGMVMPTKREKEILQLIGEGYSTKQIAEKLFISINTVETHQGTSWRKYKLRTPWS